MSLRYLYRKPSWERICPGCGKVIERNIALYGDEPWHWGCLNENLRPMYRCADCGAELRGVDVVKANMMGETYKACSLCGSSNILPLSAWRQRI